MTREAEALRRELNAWREVGEELERVLTGHDGVTSYLSAARKRDLFPDWFEPRLQELLHGARPGLMAPAAGETCEDTSERLESLIVAWADDDLALREYAALTVDEAQAVRRHAAYLASHLMAEGVRTEVAAARRDPSVESDQ